MPKRPSTERLHGSGTAAAARAPESSVRLNVSVSPGAILLSMTIESDNSETPGLLGDLPKLFEKEVSPSSSKDTVVVASPNSGDDPITSASCE